MQYKIKPRVWGAGGYNYDIMDAEGKLLCQLKAEFSALNRGNVLDMSNHPLAHISQRILSLTSEFDITVAGQGPTVVKKEFLSPLDPTFSIEGPSGSYQLEGDWKSGNYRVLTEGQTAAQVSLEVSGVQGTFTVDIADGKDIPTLLCLVMVMDEETYQILA